MICFFFGHAWSFYGWTVGYRQEKKNTFITETFEWCKLFVCKRCGEKHISFVEMVLTDEEYRKFVASLDSGEYKDLFY